MRQGRIRKLLLFIGIFIFSLAMLVGILYYIELYQILSSIVIPLYDVMLSAGQAPA